MFGLGAQEILLILVVIIFLFGAKKIPEIARGLGKGMSEFKRGMREGPEDSEKPPKDEKTP
ncbi:MAG: twin-arginine translocase TatA/TatE family subunit [Candidatus Zixiibacteriota bacterium]